MSEVNAFVSGYRQLHRSLEGESESLFQLSFTSKHQSFNETLDPDIANILFVLLSYPQIEIS